jgi:hypothetical protein
MPNGVGRSQHADSNALKASAAIPRREFVPRDRAIGDAGVSDGGACRDGGDANRVLLAALASAYEPERAFRRAEPAARFGMRVPRRF